MVQDPDELNKPEFRALSGSLTIQRAHEIKEILISWTTEAQDLVLDLSELTDLDVTGMQMLCSAHRTILKKDGTLCLKKPLPESVETTIRISGFNRLVPCKSGGNGACLWSLGAENE